MKHNKGADVVIADLFTTALYRMPDILFLYTTNVVGLILMRGRGASSLICPMLNEWTLGNLGGRLKASGKVFDIFSITRICIYRGRCFSYEEVLIVVLELIDYYHFLCSSLRMYFSYYDTICDQLNFYNLVTQPNKGQRKDGSCFTGKCTAAAAVDKLS